MVIALARLANAVFFLMTATYCLLTYSSFAYQQFIRPHLISWLSDFVGFHHIAYWVLLGLTALTMMRELPKARGRIIGWGYLVVWGAVGVAMLVRPILPEVENNFRGLVLALIALVPPIWLAIYDHAVVSPTFSPKTSSEGRILRASLIASVVVWLHQVVLVPLRLGNTGEITLTPMGVVLGVLTSGVAHLLVFSIAGLFVVALLRGVHALKGDGRAEYAAMVATTATAAALIAYHLVFGAISFSGGAAQLTAALLGILFALLWSSIACRVAPATTGEAALAIWTAPLPGSRSRAGSWVALAALGVLSYAAVQQLMTFDWDFLLQKLVFLVLWLTAVGYAYGTVSRADDRPGWASAVAPAVVAITLFGGCSVVQPRLAGWMGEPRFVPEFVLEGYVATDPSFRLIQHLLYVDTAENRAFYEYLRKNSTLQHTNTKPVDIDFVDPLGPAPGPKPHIFYFVVDSMRRDYLSPYNDRVRFTPSIQKFAAESVVFDRAYTRYGGTGLSMPAVWTGGMLLHEQYVLPFGPMNTLEKLLNTNGYRKIMSIDHITVQLTEQQKDDVDLDVGIPEMEFDFCRTMGELKETLQRPGMRDKPIFAHTRSLNLHIAHYRGKLDGRNDTHPGFLAPVAENIERIDGCFGGFIDYLKGAGLYDDSIVVLTSDHGDSLGEALRWGHAHTLYPDVIRIPLLVRVPQWVRDQYAYEPDTLAFSVDLAPTLYKLLGYEPANRGTLFGSPLFVPRGTDLSWRRSERFLLGSSYGAVYAVLSNNGRHIYIADGINSRDSAYDMTNASAERIGVTPKDRASHREFITQQVDAIGRLYNFHPGH